MKKLRLFIFISMITFLIISLSIVSKAEQIKRENAKAKLEQAMKEVPIEQNTINISEVKDKIKNDVNNSKIINENSNKFPVYTEVDGYDFKVEEDGKVEHVDESNKTEEKKEQGENTNQIIDNKGENKELEQNDTKKTAVKYIDDTKEDKGITISTTKNGIVNINGKSTEKLFIKISNGIFITDNITRDFATWESKDRSYTRKWEKHKTESKYVRKCCEKRTSKCSFKN